jgi:hypothetical protein
MMMTEVISAVALSVSIHGTVTAPTTNGTFTKSIIPLPSGKWTLVLTMTSGPGTVQIRSDDDDDIESITLSNSTSTPMTVVVGPSGIQEPRNIDEIDIGSNTNRIIISDLNISGDLGSVRVNQITRGVIDGDVTHGMELIKDATANQIPGVLGDVLVSGNVLGDIIVSGPLYTSPGGGGFDANILEVDINGTMGTPANPVQLLVEGRIIQAQVREFNGDIGGVGTTSDCGPAIFQLTVEKTGVFSGDFNGSLKARQLFKPDGLTGGALNPAIIDIQGALTTGSLIEIKQDLRLDALDASNDEYDQFLIFGEAGVGGQVIIGSSPGFTSTWDSDVEVGASTTLAQGYADSIASIGGGSIGLVPFDLHGVECVPPDGTGVALASAPSASVPIELRHYGPIAITGVETDAVLLEATVDDGSNWTTQDLDSVEVDPADPNRLLVFPAYTLQSGYHYRVRPNEGTTGSLVCNLPDAGTTDCESATTVVNPNVAAWTFAFCVGTARPTDVNGDGDVNVFDFADQASNFGTTNQCGVIGDTDNDCDVDVFDFADITADFGMTGLGVCDTEARGAAGGPGAQGAAEALGFESVEAFLEYLESVPLPEQLEAIAAFIDALE